MMRKVFFYFTLLGSLLPQVSAAQTTSPVPVTVQSISELTVTLNHRAAAEAAAMNEAQLAAEVAAVVMQVHADVGQTVAQGDLLVSLDDRDYQLQVQQAQAQLTSSRARQAEAEAKLRRARGLSESQYLSADELLERETAVAVANAQISTDQVQLQIAQRQLNKTRVVAPFSGVVSQRDAQQGSFLSVGAPLLSIVQSGLIELRAEIPATIAESLRTSNEIQFQSMGETWPVRLLRLSSLIDPQRRTQSARLVFPERTPAAGRSGDLRWFAGAGLPAHLITRRETGLGVFLLEQSVARFVTLPDAQEGRPSPVNLSADTKVIVHGREKLQDGMAVTVR